MPVLEAFIKNADLEIDIRYGSLEAVVGMVEMQPNLIKTADPSFSERILPVLFHFFQCLEDDQQWYSSSNVRYCTLRNFFLFLLLRLG